MGIKGRLEKDLPFPGLVLDAWAAPGGARNGIPPLQPEGAEEAPCPAAAAPGANGARGPPLRTPELRHRVPRSARLRSRLAPTWAGPGAGAPAEGPDPWGCGGGSATLREEAAGGSPGCNGWAGAARSAAPRWCRCPARGGDAAAGDSGRLFGSVSKVTAATRPTLNPPPRRTRGRGKEEAGGRRRGWGLQAVHFPAQNQTTAASLGLSLRDAGLGAAPGLGPRSAPPGSLRYPRYHRGSFRAQKLSRFLRRWRWFFGLFVWWWLVWHLVIYLAICCLGGG